MNEENWREAIPDYADADYAIPYYDHGQAIHADASQSNGIDSDSSKSDLVASHSVNEAHPPLPSTSWQPKRAVRSKLLYGIVGVLGALLVIFAGYAATLFLYTKLSPTSNSLKPPAPATFHYAPCPFKPGIGIVEGQELRCGFLTVPEDRSQPGSPGIQLAVAIFKAPQPDPSHTPEVYLNGGPGGALLNDLGTYITPLNLADLTLGHDLILLDQRGTGFSRPLLTCPEFTDFETVAIRQNLTQDQARQLHLRAAQTCHDRLTNAGVNLQAYTTIANATDVHDLIHTLGYKQVNLYGVSYGTRLALTMMRLFPADIRSVVLDSTVPTQIDLFSSEPAVTQHALDVLFEGCAISQNCSSTYPQLQSLFYQLVNDLNARPVTFQDDQAGPVWINGRALVSWLFQALYVTNLIPLLPEVITQISRGNYELISQYYGLIMNESSTGNGVSQSDGMYFSIECGEDMAFTTMQQLDNAVNVLRPEIRSGILNNLQNDFAICKIWGQHPVPTAQKQPVTSSIPTLILSGEYDPITPSSNAKLAIQTLSNSFFFLFPATGHGVLYTANCPDSITTAFLAHPGERPTGSCITKMQEPNFQ